MSFHQWFVRQPRLAASVAVIILSAFLTTAKTVRAPLSRAANTPDEQVFNLSDFDPVGDGVADDGPAFQRALDALADAGGGTLLIPAGTYKISTPVVKDFSSINGASVNILGVPSDTMPAPVTATGEQLAAGLNLTSEIIPATGDQKNAITLSNLHQLTIEHLAFTGIETTETDAFVTVYLSDIDKATIRHCEFYGISSFGLVTGLGGGNVIRAVRSDLSIELSVFLGCTGNSGAYAPLVENIEWRKFSISNSIFLDYGLRSFFSKTGMGAPLSWIGIENALATSPESPRREVIVRDVFLDEGGWVGISVMPYRWASPPTPIDLLYISGLKMNVSNLNMTGHLIFDVRNVFVENSHYGWSSRAYAAMDFNRVENAILDKLTCIAAADRIRTDDRMDRLTVINSVYEGLDSQARTITEMQTAPEDDPVQYVRKQFATVLGRQPDPAAHFYWSDLLIRCGSNNDCLNNRRSALSAYLNKRPQENFSVAGTIIDEEGNPLSDVTVSLSGSQTSTTVTDSKGGFRFSGLPTSGSYTVAVNKRHYHFVASSQSFVHPAADVNVVFDAVLNRHSITGRIAKASGAAISGVTVQLAQSPEITATTDANGTYSFQDLAAGRNYTVVPSLTDFAFDPVNTTFNDLSADREANFVGTLLVFSLTGSVVDENGNPLSEAEISLSGSQSSETVTDEEGGFQFSRLPTSGTYTVTVNKRHYTFTTNSQTVARPDDNVTVAFRGRLNRHSITGKITRADGTPFSGVTVQLGPTMTATTDSNGLYSFTELAAGGNYAVVPLADDFVFDPLIATFNDLAANGTANFVGKLQPELLTIETSELAVALDPVSFLAHPYSILHPMGLTKDGFVRVMVFVRNVEPSVTPSQVSVAAKDDGGLSYPLEIEYMGEVSGQSWLKQLNLRLSADNVAGKCLHLKLAAANVNSNEARICFGALTPEKNPPK